MSDTFNHSVMEHPENGLYVARVTDGEVHALHADEDAVCDAQTVKMFKDRDQSRADKEQDEAAKQREAEEYFRSTTRQAAKRKRRLLYMTKDVLGWLGAAVLVYFTYRCGLLVAVGSIVGCVVAACSRIINYITIKER